MALSTIITFTLQERQPRHRTVWYLGQVYTGRLVRCLRSGDYWIWSELGETGKVSFLPKSFLPKYYDGLRENVVSGLPKSAPKTLQLHFNRAGSLGKPTHSWGPELRLSNQFALAENVGVRIKDRHKCGNFQPQTSEQDTGPVKRTCLFLIHSLVHQATFTGGLLLYGAGIELKAADRRSMILKFAWDVFRPQRHDWVWLPSHIGGGPSNCR